MLGERRAAILSLIIDSYIKTGEPIGSKNPCKPSSLPDFECHNKK